MVTDTLTSPTIKKKNDAVLIRHQHSGYDHKQSYFLCSDQHYDSKKCNRKLLKKQLDEAVASGAKLLFFGDWFDMMGGKYDPRSHKGDIRPEYQGKNYFDLVIDDSVRFLKQYAEHIVMIAQGNHEASVSTRHERDVLAAMVYKLNHETDSNIIYMPYDGWCKFTFAEKNGSRQSKTMFYTHGSGGAGPVTKGVIGHNRKQYAIEANIIVQGDIHQLWTLPASKLRLTEQCNEVSDEVLHIQLGCFKEDRSSYYGKRRGYYTIAQGGYYIDFFFESGKLRVLERRA